MPTRWHIREFQNGRIELHDFFQAHNGGFFKVGVIQTEKLPAVVV